MEIEHLRAFAQVVRDGSFSKAARTLDVSQPSISARIAALEREVGGQLFARGGRTLALTERGEDFLPYVERALATLHEGVETVRQTGAGQRGRVTVGTIQPLCGDYLARAVERFGATHPRVDLFVRVGHSEQVVAMLHDRVVRVGVIGGWPSDWYDPAVEVCALVQQPLVLVVPAGSPLAGQSDVRLADVARHVTPLYLIEWTAELRPLVARSLGAEQALIEIPFEMAHRFMLDGQGGAFVTRVMVAADLAAERLRAVRVADLPPLRYKNAIIRLKGAATPQSVAAFIDVLRAEALTEDDRALGRDDLGQIRGT